MNVLGDMEVSSLILMARAHDDLAFAELVDRYTPMMNKVISHFHGQLVKSGEAFSEACVALYRATLTYDVTRKDVTFGLYAKICVYRTLCDIIGREAQRPEVTDEDISAISYDTTIESSIVARDTVKRALRAARELLSDYEFEIFRLYLRGYTTKEMAEELGKSPKSIDNAKSRMMKRLRENSDSFSVFY